MDNVKKLVDGVLALKAVVYKNFIYCPDCGCEIERNENVVDRMDGIDHTDDCIYELAKKMKEEKPSK